MFKRGQIAQSINWVVATVIIVVVLLISFLVVVKGIEGDLVLPDKFRDFVATKSIVNFVDNNFESIENSVKEENQVLFEKQLKPFLSSISLLEGIEPVGKTYSWNVAVLDRNDESKFETFIYGAFNRKTQDVKIVLDEDNKLNFWKSCIIC
jgi:hypothetical protein